MPIYAYRCTSCNHAQDILRKISDAPLVTCTACGLDTFAKQVTSAGFALKGSGWYVTDFRGEGSGSKSSDGTASAPKSIEKTSETAPSTAPASAPASAPSSTPAASAAASSATSTSNSTSTSTPAP